MLKPNVTFICLAVHTDNSMHTHTTMRIDLCICTAVQVWTCAATLPGLCWTTSSGLAATPLVSASSTSTATTASSGPWRSQPSGLKSLMALQGRSSMTNMVTSSSLIQLWSAIITEMRVVWLRTRHAWRMKLVWALKPTSKIEENNSVSLFGCQCKWTKCCVS